MAERYDVVVIGAGIAGLVTPLELMERDSELASPEHALLAANVDRLWNQESERS